MLTWHLWWPLCGLEPGPFLTQAGVRVPPVHASPSPHLEAGPHYHAVAMALKAPAERHVVVSESSEARRVFAPAPSPAPAPGPAPGSWFLVGHADAPGL